MEIMSTKETASVYFNYLTFLLIGAFLVDLAIEKTNLHKRIALFVILKFGTKPAHQIGAFMLVSFCLSMFCLNTSTTMMLIPFAVVPMPTVLTAVRAMTALMVARRTTRFLAIPVMT